MLSLTCVLALVACVLVALGSVAVTRHRAATAADLAAIAAAGRSLDGQVAACSLASTVVAAAGASLTSCVLVGDTAQVEVDVRPAGPLARFGAAHAGARAGPTQARRPP